MPSLWLGNTDDLPTVFIVHEDRDVEVYGFECDHGLYRMRVETHSAEEGIAAVTAAVLQHYATYKCECKPESFEEYWYDVRMALDQLEDDLSGKIPESLAVVFMEQLSYLRSNQCIHCKASLLEVAKRGQIHRFLMHEDGCPRLSEIGGKPKLSWLDFGTESDLKN